MNTITLTAAEARKIKEALEIELRQRKENYEAWVSQAQRETTLINKDRYLYKAGIEKWHVEILKSALALLDRAGGGAG